MAQSIKAIRYGGYAGTVHVFAEPGTERLDFPGILWHENSERLGCFKNFHQALEYLTASTAEYIAVLSDDFIYKRDIFKRLPLPQKNFGYLALYTPQGMRPMIGRRRGELTVVNKGWANAWGGLYVFERETAKRIQAHEFYRDHLENYASNQQIDHAIPEVCYRMKLNQYYPNPSLAEHIGKTSTIGHKHTQNERGLNFRKN